MRKRINFNLGTRRGRQLFYQSAIWRKFRAAQLAESPWCVECRADDRVRPAVDLDHVKPLVDRPDLALEAANTQGLCKQHHAAKTLKDRAA